MANVTILGAGAMGSALTTPLRDNGHKVNLWGTHLDTKIIDRLLSFTSFLNLPSKILGGVIGLVEGILYSFILLFIASVVNTTTVYVNESKYGNLILENTPIISTVTSDLVNSSKEIYNVVLNNKNNTNKANLESIDILMKYDILSYDSSVKLINDKKLNIIGIESVIEKYKEV